MLTAERPRALSVRGLVRRAPAFWPAWIVFGIGCLAFGSAAGIWFLRNDAARMLAAAAAGRPDFHASQILPALSIWIDLATFGPDPAALRICSIVFHGLNGVLLALLLNQLTRFRRPAAGWFAGLLFVLHPLHGEAVLWATQRAVVMGATFSLLSLIALEKFFRSRRIGALATCVTSAVFAGLCHEAALAVPVAMIALAWTSATPAGTASRIRRTVVVALSTAGLTAAVFVARRTLSGSWTGSPADVEAAATRSQAGEPFLNGLMNGLLGANRSELPGNAGIAFGLACLVFLGYAVVRLAWSLRDPAIRRALLVFLAFAVGSYIPAIGGTIEPSLQNGGILYQPLMGVAGALMLGFTVPAPRRPLIALLAPASLAVAFALVGQLNLRPLVGADAQLRATRLGILRETSPVASDVAVILYGMPADRGTTVKFEDGLVLALLPPFAERPGVELFTFAEGAESAWPDRVPELRRWLADRSERRVVHLVLGKSPLRVSPLVGALEPPSGASPPEILAPGEGALVVHPVEEPKFDFRPVADATLYRLTFQTAASRVEIDLDAVRHLRRAGTRRQWEFKLGSAATRRYDASGKEVGAKDPAEAWAALGGPAPAALSFVLEAFDQSGKSLGRSGARAMVLLTR